MKKKKLSFNGTMRIVHCFLLFIFCCLLFGCENAMVIAILPDRTKKTKKSVPAIDMVLIQPGTFMMGSPASEPERRDSTDLDETRHHVTITEGFYMGKFMVTQEQWIAVMGSNPSHFNGSSGREPAPGEKQLKRPVDSINWHDALEFCNKLSKEKGLTPAYSIMGTTDPSVWHETLTSDSEWDTVIIVPGSTGYRLPSEAQWEYACRAGTDTAFYNGNNFNSPPPPNYNAELVGEITWFFNNSGNKSRQVGLKEKNAWDLYDMNGNIAEWCWDGLRKYTGDPQIDPVGPLAGTPRVIRGGACGNDSSALFTFRSAYRSNQSPSIRNSYVGLRLVRPL